jgi:uncharacterized protein YjbI with pentapeptide repeats
MSKLEALKGMMMKKILTATVFCAALMFGPWWVLPASASVDKFCTPPSPELSSKSTMTALSVLDEFNGFVACVGRLTQNDSRIAKQFISSLTEPWARAVGFLTIVSIAHGPEDVDIWKPMLVAVNEDIKQVENVRARSEAFILLAAQYVRLNAGPAASSAITNAYTEAKSIDRGSSRDQILSTVALFLVAPKQMREPPPGFKNSWFALRQLVSLKKLDLTDVAGPLALKTAADIEKPYKRSRVFIEIARTFALKDKTRSAEDTLKLAEKAAKTNKVFVGDLLREIDKVRSTILPRKRIEDTRERLLATNECEGCNLTKKEFERASFKGAQLSRANFDWANLRNANLVEAKLVKARFRGANLIQSNLQDANLTRAYMSEADLTRANLDGANLFAANLSGATIYVASFKRVNLRSVNLRGVYGSYANFSNANLRGSNLSKGVFWEANFTNADLRNADLSGAKLYKANFSGADLRGVNLQGALLKKANFNGAKLD